MAGTECPGTPGTDGWQRGAPGFTVRMSCVESTHEDHHGVILT